MLRLQSLPTEIFDCICTNLYSRDLLRIRLACREINLKTFHEYSLRWFEVLSTDLSAKSLLRLKKISNRDELRLVVKGIRFCTTKEANGRYGTGQQWSRHSSGRLRDVQKIPPIILFRETLAKRFINCRTFEVCRGYYEPVSEGNDGEYRRYQQSEFQVIEENDGLSPSDVVEVLLSTLEEAGLKPLAFKLDMAPFGIVSERLDMQLYDQERFRKMWSNLEDLTIFAWWDLHPNQLQFHKLMFYHLPKLRRLALACRFPRDGDGYDIDFATASLPQNLQHFLFAGIIPCGQDFVKFIKPSKRTLLSLRIGFAMVTSKEDFWLDFFRGLMKYPKLQSVNFQSLSWCKSSRRSPKTIDFSAMLTLPRIAGCPDVERKLGQFCGVRRLTDKQADEQCDNSRLEAGPTSPARATIDKSDLVDNCQSDDLITLFYRKITTDDNQEICLVDGLQYDGLGTAKALKMVADAMVPITEVW
ncbi:MAG: hypothetical protein Q9227_008302 [Pyrenula ochraceoflavens]